MDDSEPATKIDRNPSAAQSPEETATHQPDEGTRFDDPVEAIKHYMEQKGFTQRDLVPMIGSRSKVSEVLSGTRMITMPMARALHRHLEIPAEILLQEPVVHITDQNDEPDWRRFPLRQMANRGWIESSGKLKENAEELVKDLMHRAGGSQHVTALYRKNDQNRSNAKTDPYALSAWCWQVLAQANEQDWEASYLPPDNPHELMRDVAELSPPADGPLQAVQFLRDRGIAVEIIPHLPRTHLDGAAMKSKDGRPVIGLTLRYDRIDNFWWVLMHELAHATFHLDDTPAFIDDLRLDGTDETEKEADQLAQDALIPRVAWEASGLTERLSPMAVIGLAQQLGIHPAIVAGRARHAQGEYRRLSQFVGTGEVNHLFAPELGTQ
jgi:HTH-type transcriptional regulator/antitoxin HigA